MVSSSNIVLLNSANEYECVMIAKFHIIKKIIGKKQLPQLSNSSLERKNTPLKPLLRRKFIYTETLNELESLLILVEYSEIKDELEKYTP